MSRRNTRDQSLQKALPVEIHHVIVLLIVVALALLSQRYGNQGRIQELKKIFEPLGFDAKRELDAKSSEYVYHHKLYMGLWMYIRAVYVADDGFKKIVAIDLEPIRKPLHV